MRAVLVVITFSLVSSGFVLQQAEREFTSSACHVAFRNPTDWIVSVDTSATAEPCTFVIRHSAWDSLIIEADSLEGAYTIRLYVTPTPFDEVIAMSAFEQRDSGWVVQGRLDLEAMATVIENERWRGVRATAPVGCYRIGAGYVGVCSIPMAIVGSDSFSAVLEGGVGSELVFDRVLATLKLAPDSTHSSLLANRACLTRSAAARPGYERVRSWAALRHRHS